MAEQITTVDDVREKVARERRAAWERYKSQNGRMGDALGAFGYGFDAALASLADPVVVAGVAEVLTYHCRIDSQSCRECGPLPLGSSFTRHQWLAVVEWITGRAG